MLCAHASSRILDREWSNGIGGTECWVMDFRNSASQPPNRPSVDFLQPLAGGLDDDVVVVTGSSHFIGAALINKFAGHFSLVGLDRMASHAPLPAAECVCIDLTSETGVKGAFERLRLAYGDRSASVIHLAAYYDLLGEPSPLYEQITVRGTERLLHHLQKFQVEQFVFTSTMFVPRTGRARTSHQRGRAY